MPSVTLSAAAQDADPTAIDVSWSSPGNGNAYSIYVGSQDGTMRPWIANAGAGSATFHGKHSQSYWFWASVKSGLGWTSASGTGLTKVPALNHGQVTS
jgi:hypothetical protein